MITKWNLVPSPCDRDKSRYKLLLSSTDTDLTDILEFFGQDVGKPFTPLSQEYNYAVYIYNLREEKRSSTEKFLKSKCQSGKVEESSAGKNLEEILEKVAGIEESEEKSSVPKQKDIKSADTEPAEKKTAMPSHKTRFGEDGLLKPKLNLKYVFDEFIVGANNRFVHAAAYAVSQNPGKTYNPLFIYGGVGLGKTHIMHAIGNNVKDKNSSAKILYITTEKFTSEVIEAIKNGKLSEFREHYRNLDLLLVDDIQFLSEAESTQEEFFHTFNILHENQKQIVITSDKPPKKLASIEDRLKSRFEWGLIADIKPPDLETRVAILKKKAQPEKLMLDEKILIYIASKLKSNIRELEGFLKRLKAYSSMTNVKITMELVKEFLGELLPEADAEIKETKPKEAPSSPPEPVDKKAVVEPSKPAEPAPPKPAEPAPSKPAEMKPREPEPKELESSESQPKSAAADPEYDALKPVEVGYFYPEGYESDFEQMRGLFREVIKKHKLKFKLVGVFEKSYAFDKKVNYAFFAQLCKTNNLTIMVLLGPPPMKLISEDDFTNMLTTTCETNDISAQIVPYSDLKKQYKYLNIALDITLHMHEK
ncbi:MAG: chromosomal replication initiator protein DnaA [Elusimicrobia bacterium]|nr:chromosomal replication initiator protein DnaA [Elusimicrobiota bacterium]